MTDASLTLKSPEPARPSSLTKSGTKSSARLRRRHFAERRFQAYGIFALAMGFFSLLALFSTIIAKGYPAFQQTEIELEINFDAKTIDPKGKGTVEAVREGRPFRYGRLANDALLKALGIDPDDERKAAKATKLLSRSAPIQVREMIAADLSLIGTTQKIWVLAQSDVDQFLKGAISADVPEKQRKIKDVHIGYINQLEADGAIEKKFNTGLFTFGASSRAESAGIGVALAGSLFMMLIVLVLALPIGVAASIYLEEFAPRNKWTDIVEININNLAAVPSIVFGILGLALFINFAGLPRSASIVGGLVLTLMTLPTIIIATRAALKAVPPSIREAALGIGASKTQAIFHHVLPLAMPGILTGTIIGLAQALGETAPLLMIGMVAFVADFPVTPFDPSTALPVQIYMWAGQAERAFSERTSAAIIVLLIVLAVMNITAVIVRRRFERRW